MPLTPQDVRNKEFGASRLRRGYHESEVDAFLDEVEAELTRLLTENEALRTRVHTLTEQAGAADPQATAPSAPTASAAAGATGPAQAGPVPDGTGRLPGEGVEQAALRTLQLAQRTADETVAEARQEAERTIAEAHERAAQLDGRRRDAEASVESLRDFEREYRRRLQAYFESQLRELAVGPRLEPAGPDGVRPGAAYPAGSQGPAGHVEVEVDEGPEPAGA